MNLDTREFFGRQITQALNGMADDYELIARNVRRLADEVTEIGEARGLSTLTATGIVLEAMREVTRNTPSATSAVKAAVDYEHQGFGPRPSEEQQ